MPTLKRVLEEDGVEFPAGTLPHGQTHAACPTFESNVPFVLRYMIDRDINGSTWLELPQGAYARRAPKDMVTHTQVGAMDTPTTTRLRSRASFYNVGLKP